MEKKYTVESLRDRIRELEIQQKEEGLILKKRLNETYEMFKPSNLLKSVVSDLNSTNGLGEELINSAAGFATGLITKSLIIGKTKNPFVKLIGLAIQFGMTAMITKNSGAIKTVFLQVVNAIMDKLGEKFEQEPGQE